MAYILFVNPAILAEAIDVPDAHAQLMTATALAAAIGSLLMGLLARLPFALAPGMGLNAYFAYTVVLGQGVPWPTALGAVFISGLIFIAISLSGTRAAVTAMIPMHLKLATGVGIGMFLALIGLKNSGLVVAHPGTLVALGDLSAAAPLYALAGVIVTAALIRKRVPGAMLIGIAAISLVAVTSGAQVYQGQAFAGFDRGLLQWPTWPTDTWFAMDVQSALSLGMGTIVFVFVFVDFFDTAGTLIGLSQKLKIKMQPQTMTRAFTSDALATTLGAVLGTSTTTSYIESAAGVEDGGRTGLTAVVVAVCFLVATCFWPLAAAVPAAATAPALILVGGMMTALVVEIAWQDLGQAVPAFLTMLAIPLTFSIATGISLGIISHCALALASGRVKEAHPGMYVLALLLVFRYAFLEGA